MVKKNKPYRRLPGKKRSFIGVYTLWSGSDHLLAIDSKGFSEDYKRFYYKDIQAFITRKTNLGKIQNVLLGFFCALFLFSAIKTGGGGAIFFGIMFGLCLLLLLINWLLGPTSICHLQTAVQSERLPSLSRLKTAQKSINRIRPFIDKAQGVLTSEMTREADPRVPTSISTINKHTNEIHRHEPGTLHTFLYSLLLSDSLFTTMDLFYNHITYTILTTILSMAIAVIVIIALVKQNDSDIPGALKFTTWSALIYIIICFILGYILMIAAVINNPEIANNQWQMFRHFSQLTPLENPWVLSIYLFTIFCSAILGIIGLTFLNNFRKAYMQSMDNHATSPLATPNP